MALFALPHQMVFDNAGDPLPAARLYFYENETTTQKSVFIDSDLNIPHTNPVISDAFGLFAPIWLDTSAGNYTVKLTTNANVERWTVDNVGALGMSAAQVGEVLWPQTPAETNTGLTVNTTYPSSPYDMRRAGLVPNDDSARAANTAALQALFDATVDGPTGRFVFVNSTGADTYYFDMGCVEIRNGCVIEGQGCTIDVAGEFTDDMDLKAFMTFISDVQVENCIFNVDYDGSAGANNGHIIRIGMRSSYPFGSFTGLENELDSPMANNRVLNNHFTSNNPTHMLVAMGGLQNTLIRGNTFDGLEAAHSAIYYEFGHFYNVSSDATTITTHALNFRVEDNVVSNIVETYLVGITPTAGYAVGITGAMTAFVHGLTVYNCGGILNCRVGEAFYYNMAGTPTEGMSHQAHYDLRGIVGRDNNGVGISLQGAQAVGGYLAADLNALSNIARWTAQTDLISFSVDGFYIDGSVVMSGRYVVMKNGTQTGAEGSRAIQLQSELPWFSFENVHCIDNENVGFASDESGDYWSPVRPRSGQFINCFVAGNGISGHDAGVSLGDMDGVLLDGCQFGRSVARNGVAEAMQGAGVAVAATCKNVTIVRCHGGGTFTTMYAHTATNGWQHCKIEDCSGVITTSGPWTINGFGEDAAIGDAGTTLTPGVDLPYQRNSATLGADRTYLLDTTTAVEGDTFHVTRDAATPGAFKIILGSPAVLELPINARAWGSVVYRSAAWKALGYGVFP